MMKPLFLLVLFIGLDAGPSSAQTAPKCVPNPRQLPPFDSTQVAHLAGHFHITFVDTTGTYPANSGIDLVLWINDSAHRYQYMVRRIGYPYGERPLGGAFRYPGGPWTDPENPHQGVLYESGDLYLGSIAVNDGGGTTLKLSRLGPAGFSGRWTVDLGIEVIVDSKTGRHLPNPAGYYCAWQVKRIPDSPKPATVSRSAEPFAQISRDRARFVFPPDSVKQYTWDIPSPSASSGSADYLWEVRWDVREARVGIDPEGLALVVGSHPGGPRMGSLAALLARDSVGVHTLCTTCTSSEDLVTHDPRVALVLEGSRVVFEVRGRAAVRRLFPQRPDSVTLSRRRLEEPEVEWRVPVRP